MTNKDEMPDILYCYEYYIDYEPYYSGSVGNYGRINRTKYHRAQPPIEGLREAVDRAEIWQPSRSAKQAYDDYNLFVQAAKRELEREW